MNPSSDGPAEIPEGVGSLALELVVKYVGLRGGEARQRARAIAQHLWEHREQVCRLLEPGPQGSELSRSDEDPTGKDARRERERRLLKRIVEMDMGLQEDDAKRGSWEEVNKRWVQEGEKTKRWRTHMMRYRRLKGRA